MQFNLGVKAIPMERSKPQKLFLVMKITIFLLTITFLQVSAKVFSQKINLQEKNVPITKVLSQIEDQSGYQFFYNTAAIKTIGTVTIDFKDLTVQAALDQLLKNQPFEYNLEDHIITIKPKDKPKQENTLDKTNSLQPPPIIIHGKVLDEAGQPLPGATIKIKGKNSGVLANNKGEFSFQLESDNEVLVISFIGYQTQEIPINNKTKDLVINLDRSESKLDDVQIKAYGTGTQRFNIGNQSRITAEDIEKQPVQTIAEVLSDRIPGLLITQTNGVPGSSSIMQIRGQNTIRKPGSSQPLDNPLYIIDGVPFAPQNNYINQFGSIGASTNNVGNFVGGSEYNSNSPQGMSALTMINPADIESIEVLKDADATAIYGSQGANGVILINTKKGKAGKSTLNANISTGAQAATRSVPMLNTQQYLQMRHEAYKNDGLTPSLSNGGTDLLLFDTTRYTDWQKYFLGGVVHTTNANVSVTGGTDNTQFRIAGSYSFTDGLILPGSNSSTSASISNNIHHNTENKKFSLDFTSSYVVSSTKSEAYDGSNSILSAFQFPPYYPDLFNPDGSIRWSYNGAPLLNPAANTLQPYTTNNYALNAHLQLEYKLFPTLKLILSTGYNRVTGNEHDEKPKISLDPFNASAASVYGSTADFGTNTFQNWILEPQLNYTWQLGLGTFNFLAGGTVQQKSNSNSTITGQNYTNDALLGSINGATTISANIGSTAFKYAAVYGRLGYIWDDKYIVNFSGRRDGSSRFGPGRQFGNFGSVATGWIFTQEQLLKNSLKWLSFGKLRASYGIRGSDAVKDYQYLALWSAGGGVSSSYLGVPAYKPLNLANPDYGWAVNRAFEVGLELGFLRDAVLANISWYCNRTDSQLLASNVATQTGFSTVTQNLPGLVQNSGFEFQISSTNIKSKNFSWTTNFNISPRPNNKLISYPRPGQGGNNYDYVVGQSLSFVRGNIYAGVNPTTGLYQFLSANGTLTSSPIYQNATDQPIIIANQMPLFTGGINNSVSYKKFRADVFISFRDQIGLNYLAQLSAPPGTGKNLPVATLSRWQKPGDITDVEQFTSSASSLAGIAWQKFDYSSGAWTDKSFVRIRTLSVSYDLTGSYLKRLGIRGCGINLRTENLLTLTGYKGGDPETSFYSVPPLKTIVLGLNLSL